MRLSDPIGKAQESASEAVMASKSNLPAPCAREAPSQKVHATPVAHALCTQACQPPTAKQSAVGAMPLMSASNLNRDHSEVALAFTNLKLQVSAATTAEQGLLWWGGAEPLG